MELSGWGRYPVVHSNVETPLSLGALKDIFVRNEYPFSGIVRGMGRSYGDSSLAENVISALGLRYLVSFDDRTGDLVCGAGVTLEDILNTFVPRGWFLPVTPGTKYITVGGAVASDVHGKNHHVDGSFCNSVSSLKIMLANGDIVVCSRQQNCELFRATCGGMGLTGVIVEVEFCLRSIQSTLISQKTIKAKNLEEALELFEVYDQATYSVAWIDCLAQGSGMGRSLLMLGEHADGGGLATASVSRLSVPIDLPGFVLGHYTIKIFNALYYHRIRGKEVNHLLHYDKFFYPLDGIRNWNRMYGRSGFIQYQFVIPKEAGCAGLSAILKRIAMSGKGSFLAVLKAFGKANRNILSFPMEGYTLALDFRYDRALLPLLNELDRMVLDFGGRLYLSKDARMDKEVFRQGYPRWGHLAEVRAQYGADGVFSSFQSTRLGII